MSIFGKLLGGAISIFGANKARKQARQDALSKFVDLRASADAAGINVLTALGATGGQGFGAYGSSAPPLASVELLTGALGDYEDERNGTADLRRSTDRLNYDLAKIKLDQARSGVYAPSPPKGYAAAGGTVFADNTAKGYPSAHVKTSGGKNAGALSVPPAHYASDASEYERGLKPIDLFVPYRRRDGSIVMGPNPEISDFEQMTAAGAMEAVGDLKRVTGAYDLPVNGPFRPAWSGTASALSGLSRRYQKPAPSPKPKQNSNAGRPRWAPYQHP